MYCIRNNICKYNQTGCCRFQNHCRKTHENQKCENPTICKDKDCSKRHPKPCRNLRKAEGCRFKEGCAYIHKSFHSTQQKESNEVVVSKHNNEIRVLKEEIKLLFKIILSMNFKLKTFEEAKNVSQIEEV